MAKPDPNSEDSSPLIWKLGPDRFTLRNPAWDTYVRDLALTLLGMTAGSYDMELVGLTLEQSPPHDM